MESSFNDACNTNHTICVTCSVIWDVSSLTHCFGLIYFKAFLGLELCVCGDVAM